MQIAESSSEIRFALLVCVVSVDGYIPVPYVGEHVEVLSPSGKWLGIVVKVETASPSTDPPKEDHDATAAGGDDADSEAGTSTQVDSAPAGSGRTSDSDTESTDTDQNDCILRVQVRLLLLLAMLLATNMQRTYHICVGTEASCKICSVYTHHFHVQGPTHISPADGHVFGHSGHFCGFQIRSSTR